MRITRLAKLAIPIAFFLGSSVSFATPYRVIDKHSDHWSGGAPPTGSTCAKICKAASTASYDSRCEGIEGNQYVVLISKYTDISGCTPVVDASGKVTGCEGTARSVTTEIHTDMKCPWEPHNGLATEYDKALAELKQLEKEADEAQKKHKHP